MKLIPDVLIGEVGSEGEYSCGYCTRAHMKEACDLTEQYYGSAYVDFERAEQWRLSNPQGFIEIMNKSGQLCAAFGIVALENGFMDQFVVGKVHDFDIDAETIQGLQSSKRAERLYVSGVVIRSPETCLGGKRSRVMMWAMLNYLKRIYGLRKTRTLYALGVTKESERLLARLKFEVLSPKESRKDGYNLYSVRLTKEYWDWILHEVGDLSPMCECNF